jgi:hypothetical protein
MKRLVLSLLCGLVSLVPSRAVNIAFVSFHAGDNSPSAAATTAGFTQAPDAGYTQLLTANGHTVTRFVTADNFDVSVLNSADLVIISRSVASAHYQQDNETAAWNGLTVPTIILGGYVLRGSRLGYTTADVIPDVNTSQVRLKANIPGHPIFAGVALDASGVMVNPYASIVSYTNTLQRGISVNTSPIAGNGVVIGSIGSAGDAAFGGMVIAEWIAGASMATSPVDILGAHRLILLTGSRENAAFSTNAALTAEAAGIYDLNPDGARLLLNAVNYMARSAGRRIVTVNTVNNETPAAGETSLLQALTGAQDGDYIRFAIPGDGPHVIVTPVGGYPPISVDNITIDGYSQSGTSPNTRGILEGNNAALKIVLDSSGTDTAPDPGGGPLLHRSTRLLYPGFGDTEDAILPVVGGRNFKVRGISFVSRYAKDETDDPNVYCVAYVNVTPGGADQAATGGHVSGCWFGLRPDGASLRGGRASVATFRNDSQQTATGLVIGTNGDGVDDRAEFNIHAAMSLAIHLQVADVRVSGNYVNVLPSGLNFVDVDAVAREIGAVQDPANPTPSPADVEFYENANCVNVLIGTDGNGVSDADERNIVANVSYSETMEFWRQADNVVVAGNYFGVGIDGATASPVSQYRQPDFLRFGRPTSSVRIGSNGDGVSDDIEPNLIVNVSGDRFINMSQGGAGDINEVAYRRNVFRNCSFNGLPFTDAQTSHQAYYADVVADSTAAAPVITGLAGGILSGRMAAPNAARYPFASIEVYTVDSPALANTNAVWPLPRTHPSRLLGIYTDNGAGDQDADPNEFAIDVSSAGLTDTTYVAVAVTYSTDATASNAGLSVTSPMSNPVAAQPSLGISLQLLGNAELSWLAPEGAFRLELSNELNDPGSWFPLGTGTYTGGRNIVQNAHDPFSPGVFFRLINVP